MRLPEVRHNLRLLVDVTKGDLDGIAKEGNALEQRKKWARDEDARLRKIVTEEAESAYLCPLLTARLLT